MERPSRHTFLISGTLRIGLNSVKPWSPAHDFGHQSSSDMYGNRCQLRRSTQHLHEVYSPESENLKSV
jgi:hypothetical protein